MGHEEGVRLRDLALSSRAPGDVARFLLHFAPVIEFSMREAHLSIGDGLVLEHLAEVFRLTVDDIIQALAPLVDTRDPTACRSDGVAHALVSQLGGSYSSPYAFYLPSLPYQNRAHSRRS